MKTKTELIASLPERFRGFDFSAIEPCDDLDGANLSAFYAECKYKELLNAFQTLVENAE